MKPSPPACLPHAGLRCVTFRVTTLVPLPEGEQVFITGADARLGQWKPDGLPLAREGELAWMGRGLLPTGAEPFKLTRGTWGSEEVLADHRRPPNREVPAGDEDTEIALRVHHWLDDPPGRRPALNPDCAIHDQVESVYLRCRRRVLVWRPAGREDRENERFPVLYMQDGQQVFDPATSTHGVAWGMDTLVTRLSKDPKFTPPMVVAVTSTPDRREEYNPAARGPDYARFLIEELKPFIDRKYPTLPERENTAVAGSSLGGCLAFYLAWTHPHVFSGCAALSPVCTIDGDSTTLDLVHHSDITPDFRLYLYSGGTGSIEQQALADSRTLKKALLEKGFRDNRHLLYEEDPAGQHLESAWHNRAENGLNWLFGSH